ncbi:MAG TPA: hypothetical protein GX706_03070 [Candidatus Moranbacteria bacterium]|nr:hypothetical protein [Candidatus Moranbacteria bacterium]
MNLKKEFLLLGDSDFDKLKKLTLSIYLRKINEFLAGNQAHALKIIDQENGKEVRREDAGRRMSAYDKFLTGSSSEKNSKDDYLQVGDLLSEFANKIEEEYSQNELAEKEGLQKRGLDLEKIRSLKVDASEAEALVNEMLDYLGLGGVEKSNGWKAKVYEGRKSAGVNISKKEVSLGDSPVSVLNLVPTLMGHEVVHVCQHENKDRLSSLKILGGIGLDRMNILMEAGAMQYENDIRQKIFGFKKIPIPFYVRAMERKQMGGDYLDCVETFYSSSLKILKEKKEKGLVDESVFEKERRDLLRLAINRSKRLFRRNYSLNDRGEYLTESLATNYLEQQIVSERLKEAGLEKYLYIGGINLDILPQLIKAGFIKGDSEIKMPGEFPKKIWEDRLKSRYLIG